MAFTNRFRRNTTFRRKRTGRRPSRPRVWSVIDRKANKRYQWVPLFSDVCTTPQLSPRLCHLEPESGDVFPGTTIDANGTVLQLSAAPESVSLVEPAALPVAPLGVDAGSDNTLVIARWRGYVKLYPFYFFDEFANDAINSAPNEGFRALLTQGFLGQKNYFFRAGLSKDKWTATRDPGNPNETFLEASVRDPLIDDEWTDGQFVKRWERSFGGGFGGVTGVAAFTPGGAIGVCSNTHGGATAAVNGGTWTGTEGAINTAIETDCSVVTTATSDTPIYATNEGRPAPLITLSFNSRRRFVFQENEGLTLWMNYTSFNENGTYIQQLLGHHMAVGWLMRRHIEALIEET